MTKNIWTVAALLVILSLGFYFFKYSKIFSSKNNNVVCTMEAKQCPDGTYVGREGPLCEFAPCLKENIKTTEATIETGLNKSGSALNLVITPLEVLEDSRCPVDVLCIQAGTVRLRTLVQNDFEKSEKIFVLNTPVTDGNETIELVNVFPAKNSQKNVLLSDYVFEFKIIIAPPYDLKD